LWGIKPKNGVVRWPGLILGIPRRPVAAVGIRPATTAVPVAGLCVVCVASSCMRTSTRRGTLRPSTMPAGVDLLLAGCVSTSQWCPFRRFGFGSEAQAVAFTRQSVDS